MIEDSYIKEAWNLTYIDAMEAIASSRYPHLKKMYVTIKELDNEDYLIVYEGDITTSDVIRYISEIKR